MPSIRDPLTVARRIYVLFDSCLSASTPLLLVARNEKGREPLGARPLGSPSKGDLLRAGLTPIAIGGRATEQRRAKAQMRLRTHIGRRVSAFALRFAAELCPQGHHLKCRLDDYSGTLIIRTSQGLLLYETE